MSGKEPLSNEAPVRLNGSNIRSVAVSMHLTTLCIVAPAALYSALTVLSAARRLNHAAETSRKGSHIRERASSKDTSPEACEPPNCSWLKD
jgi:hypothetical protein